LTDSVVQYSQQDGIATITFDDGKANVITTQSLAQLSAAFDRAEQEARCVIWMGRDGRFCAGFDLKVFAAGGDTALALLRGGAELAIRLYSFPIPVVIGCSGHALGMGAIYLLTADLRVGVDGAFKIGLPEVTIGMTMPGFGRVLSTARLSPTHRERAVCCAEIFAPDAALAAGFIDRLVDVGSLKESLVASGQTLLTLDATAHKQTKLALRSKTLGDLRDSLGEPLFQAS
jgi:enoyl-CoA hydratase